MKVVICVLLFVATAYCTVVFQESFDDGWEDRWVISTNKGAEAGKWVHTAGEYFNDEEQDKGIQTGEDARFYQISAKMDAAFNNKGKTTVVQYRMKNEQNLDCGGGYIKLLPPGLDQGDFSGDSDYNIMFGPDQCGATKRIHAILTYKGENYLINKNPYPASDSLSHVYTFVLNADQTYEIWVDGETKEEGHIFEDWDILPPSKIPDPDVSKPDDWVDAARIPDPEAVKPEGWDDIPEEIADPDAEMPEDWDEELDGEWEPPTMPNPEYKGEWSAPFIDNPEYKGQWEHPEIDNPDYFEDEEIYVSESEYVGFEIWQVTAGTIFSDIMVADDVADARAYIDGYFAELSAAEQAAKEAADEARRAAEEAEDDDEDDVEDDDDDDDDDNDDDNDDDSGDEPEGDDHGHTHDF